MTVDLRSTLIGRFREHLEAMPATNNVVAVGVPLGDLADIAIDTLADGKGVPLIPTYSAELFAHMRWAQPASMADVEEGGGFTTINVDVPPPQADGAVRLILTDGSGQTHTIDLMADDAQQFLLAGLAVLAQAGE